MDSNLLSPKGGNRSTANSSKKGNGAKATKATRKTSAAKHPSHSKLHYGIMYRGKVVGGISNPELFTLEGAKMYPKPYKIVKIRVSYEVVSEVFV